MSNARNLGNITTGGATGATTASVTTSINNLIDAAPGALNTLNELAAALGDDANFSTTVTNSIATKLPLAGGTMTGALVITGNHLTVDNGYGISSIGGIKYIADSNNDAPSGGLIHNFYTDNGTTSALVIAKSGNVAIGDTNVNYRLLIHGTDGSDSGDVTTRIEAGTVSSNSAVNHSTLDLTARSKTSGGTAIAHNVEIRSLGDASGNGGTMAFYTDNTSAGITERMRIDSSGNVGIGTSSPTPTASNYDSASLHISQVGSSSVGAQIRFSTGATGHTASDGTFMSQWADSNFYITNQEANADIRFNAGGNSDMVVFDGQNGGVGINFSDPASTGAKLAVMGIAGSNAVFVKGNAGSGTSWGMGINAGSTSADASFRVYDKDGSNSYLYVRGDGNIGMGTTSPVHDLHIHKTASSSQARIQLTNANTGATNADGYAIGMEAGTRLYHWLYENAYMQFSTNNTERLRINANGNIGIGTNSPGAILHVTKASVPAANTTDTDELVRFGVDGNAHGRIDLHTTSKQSTRRTTVFRTEDNNNLGFGYNAYHMGSLDIGRVDQGYTWNGYNGDGEYTSGVMNAPRYIRKAHFSGQILANNTWYTIMENVNDTRFTIECFCGDASSRDYKKYGGYYTSPAYGVYGLSQLLQVNGGWNSGSFNMRVSAPNGNLSIDLQFSSYYNSANVASWFCIYTCFV